ncbi:FusB/FusC family EF-G-binding protein [Paenibacillus aurantius]|uniref:FusB/FusC family EF-G-binding protein n=1 Tax=Paenibacillus aurantius TaxID=2918900 RepID=A0AA96L9H2_9BACL|nr:FusB/FusC family EF-G-binding protein [Paenibacillus aurantius]WNQ09008.1 FusB/FusC family EF-G-binding protein [Paenibacillus aurantius]
MNEPFIRNHEYNYIKKQAGAYQHALRTASDPKVLETVKYSTMTKIVELFPAATAEQKSKLERVAGLQTAEDFHQYTKELEDDLVPFPTVTAKQIQKLFPKNKKLKLPDLGSLDYRFLSYLGWTDIATNKLYLVVPLDGQLVGVEGRFTPTNKRSFCFACNRYEELALFSAISKKRPENASPDYYKAVGNYLCLHSQECNKNITDMAALLRFVETVIG